MAASKGEVVNTTRGLQLMTKLAASKGKLTFTGVKVGTGSPQEGTDPSELTHLVAYKMDGLIAEYGYDDEPGEAYVVMQLTNTEIETGFVMTEVGLYAQDPDLGEILYAYVDLSDDPNYIMPPENGRSKTVQIKLHTIIGEAAEIQATINPLAQVTRAEFDRELGKKVDSSGGEIGETKVTFDDSGEAEEITSFPAFLGTVVSGSKVGTFFKNFVAGAKFLLHVGSIVNDCVTDNPKLPLSAAQGKALMDLYTVLNTKTKEHLVMFDDGVTAIQSKNGQTWKRLQLQNINEDVAIFKSVDGGKTWPSESIRTLLTSADMHKIFSGVYNNIITLSTPKQLTVPGFHRIIAISSEVNSDAGSNPLSDYATGDFYGLLMGDAIDTSDGCNFGTFILTSPRLAGTLWVGKIWDYKFTGWYKK